MKIVNDIVPNDRIWTVTDTCGGTNEVILTGGPYRNSLKHEVHSANVCADPGEYHYTIKVSYFSSWAMCL